MFTATVLNSKQSLYSDYCQAFFLVKFMIKQNLYFLSFSNIYCLQVYLVFSSPELTHVCKCIWCSPLPNSLVCANVFGYLLSRTHSCVQMCLVISSHELTHVCKSIRYSPLPNSLLCASVFGVLLSRTHSCVQVYLVFSSYELMCASVFGVLLSLIHSCLQMYLVFSSPELTQLSLWFEILIYYEVHSW